MTDKIKEIAEKLFDKHSMPVMGRVMGKEGFQKALTEYESSEIARLRGIIERAKTVSKAYNGTYHDIFTILSEAEEQ